ncbi:hypothetical protein [Nannocystis punicea]|uniref:YokE-like PH domain-containing protein n=1 Tax=Nannocystis punicea TaxID=2995304 RepID=A0ABY7H1L6_9BACT|nr:hypothetical protein [Nannocystis poenicansa]WAS93147.1 hypothetical protein O0S08_43850 [Nannocystis poenicansa]
MDIIRIYAQKILDGYLANQRDRKIFPGYRSLESSTAPKWWTDELAQPEWGEILGFHEPQPDVMNGSLVVSKLGLVLFAGTVTWIAYSDIVGYDTPSKAPPARELIIHTRQGPRIALSFPQGDVFSFIRFLGIAVSNSQRT